jgi:membrane protein
MPRSDPETVDDAEAVAEDEITQHARQPIRSRWPGWRGLGRLCIDSISRWSEDRAPSMGAALAYYSLFSIAPLLLIVIAVAGSVFGADAARGAIFDELRGMLGADGAAAIQGLLDSVNRNDQSGIGAVIGGALLLIGATTVFAELQGALDRIWRAPPRVERPGWMQFLRARLLSFGLVLGVGFLLMVSLVASAAISVMGRWWAPLFGTWTVMLVIVNFVIGFLLSTLLFGMIYKWMPTARIAWRDVIIGAAGTALLFSIGKTAIGLYIGSSGVATGFGAASSLVAVMLWIYFSAQIFLVGAEFTWLYAQHYGSRKSIAAAGGAVDGNNVNFQA